MCLKPLHINGRTVPCGKCVECLQAKANDYTQIYFNLAKRYEHLHFVTFTYAPEHLNFMLIKHPSPTLSEKPIANEYEPHLAEGAELTYFRTLYLNGDREKVRLNQPQEISYNGDIYTVTPSLNRKDWRLWLKAARKKYTDKTGKILDFKFYNVGEYGSHTNRPHYHALFFGLDLQIINQLCESWNQKHGYCLVKQVELAHPDQIEAVCRYIAKYQTKGSYDSPNLLKRLVQKPRIQSSRFNLQLSDAEINWYRGTDIEPDMNRPLGDYDIETLEQINSRQFVTINGKKTRLGTHYKNKLWKFKYAYEKLNGEITQKTDSYQLYKAMQNIVLSKYYENDFIEYELNSKTDDMGQLNRNYVRKYDSEKINRETRRKNLEKNAQKFVKKMKI